MMTPKEKAKELVERFSNVKRPMLKGYKLSVYMHPEHAKQCALMAVDEIIEFGNQQGIREPMMYWQSVKQEINKL